MKDTIVQEVRDARAAIAADFNGDLGQFFTWAKAHTAAERKAKHPLPTHPTSVPSTKPKATRPAKTTRRKTAKSPSK